MRAPAILSYLITGALIFTAGHMSARLTESAGRPVASPLSSPAPSEDSPGWDGLRQGNHVARVDGLLLFNLDSLSGDPYADCLSLLDLWQLTTPDHAGFVSADLCEPVYANR